MRISDWSSDVCSSDLVLLFRQRQTRFLHKLIPALVLLDSVPVNRRAVRAHDLKAQSSQLSLDRFIAQRFLERISQAVGDIVRRLGRRTYPYPRIGFKARAIGRAPV